ncbi:hypothetical protein PMIN01_09712 [Paraphaeosphaeria minitans]|uniref:Uncharacterized protein n=1 Tax=Paraphaeosphaeria minitans TaxID=565426 RepID=A0A9P6KLQ6_9PLEO|nr:hypothetical protein PMIN01_09712 [Paraphaeosphaeria minitans]
MLLSSGSSHRGVKSNCVLIGLSGSLYRGALWKLASRHEEQLHSQSECVPGRKPFRLKASRDFCRSSTLKSALNTRTSQSASARERHLGRNRALFWVCLHLTLFPTYPYQRPPLDAAETATSLPAADHSTVPLSPQASTDAARTRPSQLLSNAVSTSRAPALVTARTPLRRGRAEKKKISSLGGPAFARGPLYRLRRAAPVSGFASEGAPSSEMERMFGGAVVHAVEQWCMRRYKGRRESDTRRWALGSRGLDSQCRAWGAFGGSMPDRAVRVKRENLTPPKMPSALPSGWWSVAKGLCFVA